MAKALFGASMAVLTVLFWLHSSSRYHADESSAREYWYSNDPDKVVFAVRFSGGRSAQVHHHRVFADGRYEYQLTDLTGEQTFQKSEVQIPEQQSVRH